MEYSMMVRDINGETWYYDFPTLDTCECAIMCAKRNARYTFVCMINHYDQAQAA